MIRTEHRARLTPTSYTSMAASIFAATMLFGATVASAQTNPPATGSGAPDTGEILVTAQKRTEDIKNVPLSISVLKGDAIEQQKIVDYQDLGRVVPGLAVTNTGASSLSRLSLRGVSSDQGTSTVGIYLEDISLTIPNLFFTGSTLPTLFDIDHVEVLRGPQGTLFGASSLGGAIRFIPNKPNLEDFSGEIRGDLSTTHRAGTNYVAEGVVNLPIVRDKMALRVGVQRRDDSGYVTRYDGAGSPHANVGGERTTAVRATLLIQPDDSLSIEPALLWQQTRDNGTSIFQLSDLPDYRQDKLTAERITDRLLVPSLTVRKDIGNLQATSVSSYVQRNNDRRMDGQIYNSEFVGAVLDPSFGADYDAIASLPGPYYNAVTAKQFSQEVRIGSKSTEETGSRLEWQVGVYYFRQKIRTLDDEYVTGLGDTLASLYPGADSESLLGAPLIDNELGYFHYTNRQRETAVFAQASYKILPSLKFTVGGRQSWAHTSYSTTEGGFLAEGSPANYRQSHGEHPFTPKFSLTYDASRQATFYATIAKGYRLGGENSPLPTSCGASLQAFGVSSSGAYDADSLWSYEAGAKLRLFNNRLSVNASGYYIDWSNIQQKLALNSCGYVTTVNAGNARSYGGEGEIIARLTRDLSLSFSGSVTDAKITRAAAGTGASDGQYLPYVPRYNITVGADYSRPLQGDARMHAHVDVDRTGPSNGTFLVSDPDYHRPAYTVVNFNIGFTTGPIDISFFARNLLNNDTIIQRPTDLFVAEGLIVRPRTLGVSGVYKF